MIWSRWLQPICLVCNYTTCKVDGATPVYWVIVAPYYSTFWEWLAIYFHHGVHFSDHLCVGVSKGLFLNQTLMDFREVKGISYNSSCLAQSPCAWVVVTTAIKYKISLWSSEVLHWCIQHIESMLLLHHNHHMKCIMLKL